MARRTLIQRSNRPSRFDKYLLRRRSIQDRVGAHTPIRFLTALGLISEFGREESEDTTFTPLLDNLVLTFETPTPQELVERVVRENEGSAFVATEQHAPRVRISPKVPEVARRSPKVSPIERPSLPIPGRAQETMPTRQQYRADDTKLPIVPGVRLPADVSETMFVPENSSAYDEVDMAPVHDSSNVVEQPAEMPVVPQVTQEPETGAETISETRSSAIDSAELAPLSVPVESAPLQVRRMEKAGVDEAKEVLLAPAAEVSSPANAKTVPHQPEPVRPLVPATEAVHPPAVMNIPVERPVPVPSPTDAMPAKERIETESLPPAMGEKTETDREDIVAAKTVDVQEQLVHSVRSVSLEPGAADHESDEAIQTASAPPVTSAALPPEVEQVLQENSVSGPDLAAAVQATAQPAAEVKAETSLVAPPRRARIEEISPDRQGTGRSPSDNVGDAQPKDQSPNVAKQRSRPAAPSGTSEAREPLSAEELFTSKSDVDRSPGAWAEKLRQAFGPRVERNSPVDQRAKAVEHQKAENTVPTKPAIPKLNPAASAPAKSGPAKEAPVVLSNSTRRFLKPLVGVDPATVPVYEGPLAAEITSSNNADAVVTAGNIALSPTVGGETPERLGLLAHELTHIVRQRKPRFIPPIARQRSDVLTATPAPEHMDEEALARRVEARVIEAASNADAVNALEVAAAPQKLETGLIPPDVTGVSTAPVTETAQNDWGGLPAPWEPLPDWVLALPQVQRPMEGSDATRSEFIAPASNTTAAVVSAAAPSVVERAETGRILDHPAVPAALAEAAGGAQKSAPPDLDALARQVYSVLKRKLENEHRRQLI